MEEQSIRHFDISKSISACSLQRIFEPGSFGDTVAQFFSARVACQPWNGSSYTNKSSCDISLIRYQRVPSVQARQAWIMASFYLYHPFFSLLLQNPLKLTSLHSHETLLRQQKSQPHCLVSSQRDLITKGPDLPASSSLHSLTSPSSSLDGLPRFQQLNFIPPASCSSFLRSLLHNPISCSHS